MPVYSREDNVFLCVNVMINKCEPAHCVRAEYILKCLGEQTPSKYGLQNIVNKVYSTKLNRVNHNALPRYSAYLLDTLAFSMR